MDIKAFNEIPPAVTRCFTAGPLYGASEGH